MNELKVFQSTEFGQLEVLLIDGREYFPATACAKKLGHENPSRAIRKFCKGVTELVTPTNGGSQTMRYIPEGDLYRLIVNSKLPSAEKFERWVFDEVLPSLRKQGMYAPDLTTIIQQTVQTTVSEVMRQMIPLLTRSIADRESADLPTEDICTTTTIITETRRKRRNTQGKIENLPQELYTQVVDMLRSRASYKEVQQFLAEQGYKLSQMAVCRYYNKAHESEGLI